MCMQEQEVQAAKAAAEARAELVESNALLDVRRGEVCKLEQRLAAAEDDLKESREECESVRKRYETRDECGCSCGCAFMICFDEVSNRTNLNFTLRLYSQVRTGRAPEQFSQTQIVQCSLYDRNIHPLLVAL